MAHTSPLVTAPAFQLPNQKGQTTSLEAILARGRVLLAFHRGTW
jgi:peroxiredoxin